MLDLGTPIDHLPLVFLDVETTGLNPALGDRVCEVALLRCVGDEVVDSYQQLVNPGRRMSPGAYAVHGISDEMLADAPRFPRIAADLISLLDGAVFVGHNAPFDLGFVSHELARSGIDMPDLVALDTLRLAKRLYRLPSYSLSSLVQSLDVGVVDGAHRAMVDVALTRAVFLVMAEASWGQGTRTLGDLVAAQGGPLTWATPTALDIPPLIQGALAGGKTVVLRYRDESGSETTRLVEPLTVVQRGGSLLLVGHCRLRDARRTFRLDRVLEIDVVEAFD